MFYLKKTDYYEHNLYVYVVFFSITHTFVKKCPYIVIPRSNIRVEWYSYNR